MIMITNCHHHNELKTVLGERLIYLEHRKTTTIHSNYFNTQYTVQIPLKIVLAIIYLLLSNFH
jgi:hypothetical protein